MSKRETEEIIQEFYNQLSLKYRDLPIWSNLDREHLFLYISHYKKVKNKLSDLSELMERIFRKKSNEKQASSDLKDSKIFPSLNEGVFAGTFNFNLAKIIHAGMAGNISENGLKTERTNILFDTNNNRIFTVTDFARDILDNCSGRANLSDIINKLKEKYQMDHSEADLKCKNFLDGLKRILSGLSDCFYGALGFIFFEPQFGHSVAPFFMNVFLHDMHQYMPYVLPISASSSGFISNGVYVLHIVPTSVYNDCIGYW
ncbi:MAG: PqqD family protein [Candidatus Methanoperedens sp.]|nr:PqqD family protein [Candidatus Methanoperedens sp.]